VKIAIFSDVFLPHADGVATSTAHLAEELLRLGQEVLVIAPSYKGEEVSQLKGVPVFRLLSVPSLVYPDFRLGLLSPRLLTRLRKFSPELIHIQTPATIGIQGVMAGKIFSVPVVGTFHAYFMEPEYLQIVGLKYGLDHAQRLLWRAARAFYDMCEVLVSPSELVKKDLLKHGFTQPVTVIHNGISMEKFKAMKGQGGAFKKKYGVGDEGILFAGRLSKEKNLGQLMEVFGQVHEKRAEAQLVIVGGGPLEQDLKEWAREKKLEKAVIFTGEMKHHELLESGAYEAARVFVTCSTSEVQPMTLIEAMTFGCPIVAAKARGVVEMIDDNGFLISPTKTGEYVEKIVSILASSALSRRLSLAALERASRYDLDVTVQEYEKLYQRVVSD